MIESVLENKGLDCPNCEHWRILRQDDFGQFREIETCTNCGDPAFDIYNVTEMARLALGLGGTEASK